jgi:hypothetical protein
MKDKNKEDANEKEAKLDLSLNEGFLSLIKLILGER